MTDSGAFMGTIEYAAPEQIEGAQVDARTDIYGLGCVFYECLTGEVPFAGASATAIMYAHLFKDPPSVKDVVPALPSHLDKVIGRALARRPEDRYATCRELIVATDSALHDADTPSARPRAPATPPPRPAPVHLPTGSAGRALFNKVKDHAVDRLARSWTEDSARRSEATFTPPRYLIGFQSLAARSKQLQRWLLGSAALDAAVAIISGAAFISIAGSTRPRVAARAAIDPGWITGLQVVVFLIVALMFVVWLYRAYANLPHLGIANLRFSRVWALTSWVIPVVNLWRPKQIINDIWRASDPNRSPHESALWRGKAVPGIFLLWWCALVGSKLLALGPLASLFDSSILRSLGIISGRAHQAEAHLLIATLASGLSAVAALLSIRVVGMTSARQEARLEKLLTPPSDRG